MQGRPALGRGIDAIIQNTFSDEKRKVEPKKEEKVQKTASETEKTRETVEKTSPLRMVPLDKIIANKEQPRSLFDEEKLRELSASIKEQGVLQPILVKELSEERYELIAGERRLRASKLAGLAEIPVIIKNVKTSKDMLVLAILENIQREDLNPIEEAIAYRDLADRFQYSQEEIAAAMGKSRTAVTNSMRLLKLPQIIREDLAQGRYSAGHARALLSLTTIHEQLKCRETILSNTISVRDLERHIQKKMQPSSQEQKKRERLDPQLEAITDRLKQELGTKVSIKLGQKGAGKIVIEYYNQADLDRIYHKIS